MARRKTWGYETGQVGVGASGGIEGTQSGGLAPTVSSAAARSGTYSLKCDSGGANTNSRAELTGSSFTEAAVTTSATNYLRAYFRFDALPSTDAQVMLGGTSTLINARLTTAGKLQLWNGTGPGTQVGSDSAATIAGDATTWYRIELAMTLNATPQITAIELMLDGVSVASTSGLTLAITAATNQWLAGWVGAPGANKVCYVDDFAINDSTGADQNSWPGEGNVVLLSPTADSAGGSGWTLGTGTALGGNGFAAVDNKPPVGVADLAVGSDPKQIRNAAAAANSNYDVTLQTYTAAGVPSGATIDVVDPVISTAAPVTTSSKQGTVGVVSNPAITNVALGAGGTAGAFWAGSAAAAFPLGWKASHGTITHSPGVTLGTAPVMRVTQVTSSTRIAMVCFMGLYVEYTAAASPGPASMRRQRRASRYLTFR